MDIGKNSAQTVKSENAKLVMNRSGIVRRVSFFKTARRTKALPILPMRLAKAEITERTTIDSFDKTWVVEE